MTTPFFPQNSMTTPFFSQNSMTTPFFLQSNYMFQNPNPLHPPGTGLGGYGGPSPNFGPFQIPVTPNPDVFPVQHPAFLNVSSRLDPREVSSRVEAAVAKAHQDLLAAGEQVSSWKVSQAALMSLKADSWVSLGLQMQDVPYLRRLMSTEGKVDAFIHCFVGSRKITSVHDLDTTICLTEGVERFEELGLGPLLRHPLIKHYFSIPSDALEVPKITSEDIVACLRAFMKNGNKMVIAEDFLSFLVQKYSVESKEMVGVRIRNLGFYITRIRQSEKAELSTIQMFLKTPDPVCNNKTQEVRLHPPIVQEKLELDRRFGLMSGRIDTFSENWKSRNTHIRFDSLSDDDEDNDSTENNGTVRSQNISTNQNVNPRVSGCPYPSTTEEMVRLGLKSETRKGFSTTDKLKDYKGNMSGEKKRKINETRDSSSSEQLLDFFRSVKARKCDFKLPSHLKGSFELNGTELKDFMATWKYQCQEHSVLEVLNAMLSFYAGTLKRRKRKSLYSMIEFFSSYPGIGLLNVSVASVKCGMIDTLYDTFESIGQASCEAFEMIDVGPAIKEVNVPKDNVTSTDIIEKMSTYMVKESPRVDSDLPRGKFLSFLKMLRNCESFLTSQFSVQEFSSLGHGDIYEFLYKNISLLPNAICSYFMGGMGHKFSPTITMHQNQLQLFISQVDNIRKNASSNLVYALLRRQYPTVNFIVDENVLDNLPADGDNSSSVLFSAALLCKWPIKDIHSSPEKLTSEILATRDVMPQQSSEDALRCLLRAPFLSDLLSWSHWDIMYAPSLGPLLPWLMESVCRTDLSCIATSDGKLIRIDPLATPDAFLDAAIRESSFQTAVMFLSLIAVYGGIRHVPKSLLKQLAQRAFEVMTKNSGSLNVKIHGPKLSKLFCGENALKRCSDIGSFCPNGQVSGDNLDNAVCRSDNTSFSVPSNFILDCLSLLPSEFRNFATEVLVSGFHSCTREAYSVILLECKCPAQRTMLHGIGLSLGIVEWIENYNTFILDSDCNLCSTSQLTLAKCTSESPESSKTFNNKIATKVQLDDLQKDPEYLSKNVEDGISEMADNYSLEIPNNSDSDAVLLIESIRREEFGLVSSLEEHESNLLQKQHARLGRALHCLSQELYSQDSHFILELIQNADDNSYPEDADPTLIFIIQKDGVIILNNEHGFTAQNIRALCDIGNSTKRASTAGYIGNKGIGFKSVFRVTDAPEIHSNGFHIKFDISEGQIGFILPTIISPIDINIHTKKLSLDFGQNKSVWNTCIALPFRDATGEDTGINSVISLFSDLHPSLLLFLHRLKCIQLRNMLNDTHFIMKRETSDDGIVRVTHGNSITSWLVVRKGLQCKVIRASVQSTEIAVAFTLQESNGEYIAHLSQQPVFAFLPLRKYGLKFILQGDFVLPSSREEVDGDSAWNQWLLSEIPSLFVSAERLFCQLICFKDCPGKAVSTFMSFVPLVGEVHGFFTSLPNMILSKLCSSCCLLLEGNDAEWFPPCRALRGWDEQVRTLLPDSLIEHHLGLGYLKRDISLSEELARALGVRSYGPKLLVDIISSMCQVNGCLKLWGLDWLASFFVVLNAALSAISMEKFSGAGQESDLIHCLRKIPIIPLSDGSFGSVAEDHVWLPPESLGMERNHCLIDFPHLYGRLRVVDPLLLSAEMPYVCCDKERRVENIRSMLHKIGVQQLSAHEIIRTHIMHHLTFEDNDLMIEYLAFVMLHFQCSCRCCLIEKDVLISELRSKPIILTNYGFKSPIQEHIHFSRDFGNPFDLTKLMDLQNATWLEVDTIYLKHPSTSSLTSPLKKWRDFFVILGVSDFVQVTSIKKDVSELNTRVSAATTSSSLIIQDWECPELFHLLSSISMAKNLEKSRFILEILDRMWDDNYSAYSTGVIISEHSDEKKIIKSSFMNDICRIEWFSSTIDDELHLPTDLFHDCDEVRSMLGTFAPYANPKVNSKMFLNEIGFKREVTLEDAIRNLQLWATSDIIPMLSIVQMCKFYHFIWDRLSISRVILDQFRSMSWIFVPSIWKPNCIEPVRGSFFPPNKVYWHDPTGCIDQIRASAVNRTDISYKTLDVVYPGLHDFFVNLCGVKEMPCSSDYVEILLQLSSVSMPSQASHNVLKVFLKWADDIKSGKQNQEEMVQLKESLAKMENTILPTMRDKWVSMHPAFGLICWVDDEELMFQCKHSKDIDFLHFGDLKDKESIFSCKLMPLMQELGIPALSEVVSREAIFYGIEDNRQRAALVNCILPYAQRYLFKLQSDRYEWLKKVVPGRLNQLQVCVVESLFYKHTLKGNSCFSKNRFESSCLLQGNNMYIKRSSDSHSIFLELSRIFFDGVMDLQLANFLHIISTMVESGSSWEQIDVFAVNSQKIPKLPAEEPVWSLSCFSAQIMEKSSLITPMPLNSIETVQRNSGKPVFSSIWPPTDWKNVPGCGSGSRPPLIAKPDTIIQSFSEPSAMVMVNDFDFDMQAYEDCTMKDGSTAKSRNSFPNTESYKDQTHLAKSRLVETHGSSDTEVRILIDEDVAAIAGVGVSSISLNSNESLSVHPTNEGDAYITGRLGEAAAYKYFLDEHGPSAVKWVNKELETGLPYDLLIGEDEGTREYVEVKSTKSRKKNWFQISTREWQFAVEKGDSFSIARVVLMPPKTAQVAVFRNPIKLCQKNFLHLAVVMPKDDTAAHADG